MAVRSTAEDGLANRLETYATTHFEPLWDAVQRSRPVRRRVNRVLINRAILKMPTRPNPLSTKADYTSWDSLTDRRFDSRHLPPAAPRNGTRPEVERVADLFARSGDGTPVREVDGAVRVLRGVVHRRVPAQRPLGAAGHAQERLEPRDRPDAALRRPGGGDAPAADLRRRTAEEPDDQRRGVPPFLCQGGAIKPEFRG
jgi:prostaglandin-endoperoxide synthase 2